MSHPNPHPADDLSPSGTDAETASSGNSNAGISGAGVVGGRNPAGESQARGLTGATDDLIHHGAGGILQWAAGETDDDADFDGHDLADTVDVSSTVDELVVYLDGYLDDAQRRRVEQRLVEDESARENLAALQNSWDALDCLPRPACNTDFTESTMRLVVQKELAVRPAGKLVRKIVGWVGVATLLLFSLGMGYFVSQRWESADEREFFESYRLVRDWEKYQLIGDFEFLLRLEKDGLFAGEVPHVEP